MHLNINNIVITSELTPWSMTLFVYLSPILYFWMIIAKSIFIHNICRLICVYLPRNLHIKPVMIPYSLHNITEVNSQPNPLLFIAASFNCCITLQLIKITTLSKHVNNKVSQWSAVCDWTCDHFLYIKPLWHNFIFSALIQDAVIDNFINN